MPLVSLVDLIQSYSTAHTCSHKRQWRLRTCNLVVTNRHLHLKVSNHLITRSQNKFCYCSLPISKANRYLSLYPAIGIRANNTHAQEIIVIVTV